MILLSVFLSLSVGLSEMWTKVVCKCVYMYSRNYKYSFKTKVICIQGPTNTLSKAKVNKLSHSKRTGVCLTSSFKQNFNSG